MMRNNDLIDNQDYEDEDKQDEGYGGYGCDMDKITPPKWKPCGARTRLHAATSSNLCQLIAARCVTDWG